MKAEIHLPLLISSWESEGHFCVKKDVLFIIEDWNAKAGTQETPGVTDKFGLGVWNEAGQRLIRVLSREHTGHSKYPLPTTQEKTLYMDITRWSTPKPDWL